MTSAPLIVSLDFSDFRKFSNATKQSLSQAKAFLDFPFLQKEVSIYLNTFLKLLNEPACLLSCQLLWFPLLGLLDNRLQGDFHLPVAGLALLGTTFSADLKR